jgi:Mg2+-importing ATPase
MGFASFLDPVKKDVKKTISRLLEIGVDTKVITGDSEIVARKICGEAGVENSGLMTGSELDTITDEELPKRALQTSIFARVSPVQKERIITALKKTGQAVAYLGDGINDAPSLKAADVGISVDNAVDVAREAADLILTHKSLGELGDGMMEGRKTFVNTMKYVRIGLSSSFGNVISLIVAAFTLPFLPLLPLQILIHDFLYDVSQLALASDNVANRQVYRPQKWDLKEIKRFIFIFGPLSSVFDLTLFALLILVFHLGESEFQTSWFIFSVLSQTMALFIMRTPHFLLKSHPSRALLLTTTILVVIGLLLAFSWVGQRFFAMSANLTWPIVATIGGVLVAYVTGLEIAKYFYFRAARISEKKA